MAELGRGIVLNPMAQAGRDAYDIYPSLVDALMRSYGQAGVGEPSGKANGLLTPGNIDLATRPRVKNPDGTISTVRSISFNIDGKEVLVPTVSDDGRIMEDEEAFQTFLKTGKHLGIFDTPDNATAYANSLHDAQANMIER